MPPSLLQRKYNAEDVFRHNDLPYHILTKGNNDLTNFDFSSNLGDHPVYKGLHTDLPRLRQGKVGAQVCSNIKVIVMGWLISSRRLCCV